MELLLTVMYEYKVKLSGKCNDWEKVKTKYMDIHALFQKELPSRTEEAFQLENDYPHHPDQIALKCLTSKLKAILLKYAQAINSGKKSGHQQWYKFRLAWRVLRDLSRTPAADGGEPSAVVPDVAGMTPEGPHDTEGDIDREEEASQQPPDTDGVV